MEEEAWYLRGNSSKFDMRNLESQETVLPSMKYHLIKNVSENTYLEIPHICEHNITLKWQKLNDLRITTQSSALQSWVMFCFFQQSIILIQYLQEREAKRVG